MFKKRTFINNMGVGHNDHFIVHRLDCESKHANMLDSYQNGSEQITDNWHR